jgi:hypothetical protein
LTQARLFSQAFHQQSSWASLNQSLIRIGAAAFFFGAMAAGAACGAPFDTMGVGAGSVGRRRGNGVGEDFARW